MLVLARKVNETIIIYTPEGEKIIIGVGDITGKRARLTVIAPQTYRVLRGELGPPKELAPRKLGPYEVSPEQGPLFPLNEKKA